MRRVPLLLLAALGIHAQEGAERLDPSSTTLTTAPQLQSIPSPSVAVSDSTQARDTIAPTTRPSPVPSTSDSISSLVSGASRSDSTLAPIAVQPALQVPPPVVAPPQIAPRAPGVVVRLDTSAPAMARKSIWLASGLSLLLPGAGEQYLGATTRAKTFFAVELVSVAAAWLSWRTREDALVSARELASRYAGADTQDKSIAFLELMAQYRSRRPVGTRHDSYDEAMLLSGQNPDRQFPLTDSYTWDWGSSENPENDAHLRSFESQLRSYRASKIALSFSLGAMGVSRILSLADVLWLHRRASWIQAEVIPLPQGAAGRLAWRF
jgi:hypothetical protein